jgi:hypothetical protein
MDYGERGQGHVDEISTIWQVSVAQPGKTFNGQRYKLYTLGTALGCDKRHPAIIRNVHQDQRVQAETRIDEKG